MRKNIKKSALGLAGVCIFLLAAISCEIPEAITFRGSPGVHMPMGSPFDLMGTRLEDYISSDKIKEMMGGKDGSAQVYEYTGSDVTAGVEAYIILYPITEMELDLQEYIDRRVADEDTDFTYAIPPAIADKPLEAFPSDGYYLTRDGSIPVETPHLDVAPLFTLVLTDMANLVIEVTGGPFGLELDHQPDFEDYLLVSIPALGITDYIQGEVVDDKLRFVNNDSSFTLKPQEDLDNGDEIGIYVITTGPCSGTIEPKMVFEWETATIDAEENPLSDIHTIDNKDLDDFFGEGTQFKEAKGYIYAGGVGDNEMSLGVKDNPDLISLQKESLTGQPQPLFSDRFNEKIPAHSLARNFIDMTDTLNASIDDAIELEYELVIKNRTITRTDLDEDAKIFANLAILLPMEFKANAPPGDAQYVPHYAKLDMKGLFPNKGSQDLFQREGGDDDLFNALETVTFLLSNYQNDVFGRRNIYIGQRQG